MGAVRTAERLAGVADNRCIHSIQVSFRQHDIAVKHDEIFALGTLRTVVAALSGTGVGLAEILDIQLAVVLVAHLFARYAAAVLHDDDLKVAEGLMREALKQFVHFVGTIVNGYDNRVFHVLAV